MAADGTNGNGARATRPTDIPPRGWKQIALRAWKEASEDNIGLLSAGVAFYAFLAFVPLLAAMVLTYGLVAEPASVVQHIGTITNLMPRDAASLVADQLRSVVETAETEKGLGLVLALLLAVYGAMRGAVSIITALNVVNEVEERRSFVRKMFLALLITLGALAALLVAVLAISMFAFVERWLPASPPILHTLLHTGFWLVAAVVMSLLIAAVYRYGPNRNNVKWRWLTPGSSAATLAWIAATSGFGLYVASFGNYNATYGSLGAVIVFLIWLYLSAYILLLGAELNSETERQTRVPVTEDGSL